MTLKAAFMFVAPQANPEKDVAIVCTPDVELKVIAVKDYTQAEQIACLLAEQGVVALELCAGFGTEGVARIKRAVGKQTNVGAVRFDYHPGLDFQSGDDLFQ